MHVGFKITNLVVGVDMCCIMPGSHVNTVVNVFFTVEKWRNLNGNNLLQLMYTSKRHSYTFQSYVQLTMAQLHAANVPTPIKMIERSLWSSRHVFGKNLEQTKKMAQSEFEVLNAWFEFLKSCPDVDLGVDIVVYLRTSPDVAYKRLKARARSEEKVVSIDYLKDLHEVCMR